MKKHTPESIDPVSAVEYILRVAPEYSQAKGERIYLEEFRKSKKALLMKESDESSIAAQERDAYANPEYIELIKAIGEAVEREEHLRWMLVGAQTKVEVWRSMESTNRLQDRSTQ